MEQHATGKPPRQAGIVCCRLGLETDSRTSGPIRLSGWSRRKRERHSNLSSPTKSIRLLSSFSWRPLQQMERDFHRHYNHHHHGNSRCVLAEIKRMKTRSNQSSPSFHSGRFARRRMQTDADIHQAANTNWMKLSSVIAFVLRLGAKLGTRAARYRKPRDLARRNRLLPDATTLLSNRRRRRPAPFWRSRARKPSKIA